MAQFMLEHIVSRKMRWLAGTAGMPPPVSAATDIIHSSDCHQDVPTNEGADKGPARWRLTDAKSVLDSNR